MSAPSITRRRDASYTRDDISAHQWPIATQSLLADHERLAASHSTAEINQPLFALIRARKALSDARIACYFAARLNASNIPVRDRLESIAAAIEQEAARFPLEMVGQRHERASSKPDLSKIIREIVPQPGDASYDPGPDGPPPTIYPNGPHEIK